MSLITTDKEYKQFIQNLKIEVKKMQQLVAQKNPQAVGQTTFLRKNSEIK